MRLLPKNFSITLPFIGGVSLDISEEAERAAWALYVEFNTRISTKPLQIGEGNVREALTSLYSLFGITRDVLKHAGVDVARARKGNESLGSIAMRFLNEIVRPALIRWHSSLSAHEATTWKNMIEIGKSIPNNRGVAAAIIDELMWDGYESFFDELEELQSELRRFIAMLGALASVSDSPDVIPTAEED